MSKIMPSCCISLSRFPPGRLQATFRSRAGSISSGTIVRWTKGTPKGKVLQNRRLMSSADPDAPCVRKKSGGESLPRYKAHRAVDDAHAVITATETTPGDTGENERMKPLLEQHERNLGSKPKAVVADSQYGPAENYRDATAMGISTHVKPYARRERGQLYGKEKFLYHAGGDTYECPAGNRLYPRRFDKVRWAMEYIVRKGTCDSCPLKSECTNAKMGRTALRRWAQELIDEGVAASESAEAKRDLKRRMWLMEGSFAQSVNLHGFKRSRWRRLHRQRIQDHIICAVQNMKILISKASKPLGGGEDSLQSMYAAIRLFMSAIAAPQREPNADGKLAELKLESLPVR